MSASKLGSIWRDSVRPVRRFYRVARLIDLRRLSVNSDKCPSHVFRVTEANRLRNAFDRFCSRLYAASGYGSGDAAELGWLDTHRTHHWSTSVKRKSASAGGIRHATLY